MTILTDRDIYRLSNEVAPPLIYPMIPALIRRVNDGKPALGDAQPNDRGVISYGRSSYGYDLRLSPKEFRILQHIPGTVVDPKRFNPDNLKLATLDEDEMGKFFILPGHSYGLGFSIELLSLPKNITAFFIGKSTYARCFAGDTKVKLVDGDFTFLELIERVNQGDRLYGYGVNTDMKIVIQELTSPRLIEKSKLVRVSIDNDDHVDCTPDHVFLLRDGTKKQAQHLAPGDSLYAIYQYLDHGYPVIYDTVLASTLADRRKAFSPIHRMVGQFMYGDDLQHLHHIDGNRFNNHPSNLQNLSSADHTRIHNNEDARHIKGGMASKTMFESNSVHREKILKALHSDETKEKTRAASHEWKHSQENKASLGTAREKRWQQAESRANQSEVAKRGCGSIKRRDDITEETLTAALLHTGTIRGAAKSLNVDRAAFRRFPSVISKFKAGKLAYNHKVVSVTPLNGEQNTYCLTAPDNGNFALSAGIFVNNCGIIANLTPGEAGWCGHLTIEISNASPADTRIYAGEGICQAVFFEGQPCENPYGIDRKYQNQGAEVVLPSV
jgi:dCTP deaminase